MQYTEKKFVEGSQAIAEAVAMCNPDVVAAYPITPQTHIVENLAKLKADGKLKGEYLYAESEFAAASMILGASATGSRAYSATTSQGLLLMTEVIYNIAGMRLPMVMTIANRSVGAPLSIWNDTQDTVSVRDAGWINLWAEDLTEAALMHVAAFRISEEVDIPVIVNMDGFVLTHTAEVVEMPTAELIKKVLSKRKAKLKLDPKNPVSMGTYADPSKYHLFRKDLHDAIIGSEKKIKEIFGEINKLTGKLSDKLAEGYKNSDAEVLLISSGSLVGTMKDAVDEMRNENQKVGVVNVRSLRPFPDKEIISAVKKAKYIAVLDKNISLGTEGILASEIKRSVCGSGAKIQSFVVGLGGKDIKKKDIKDIVNKVKGKDGGTVFV